MTNRRSFLRTLLAAPVAARAAMGAASHMPLPLPARQFDLDEFAMSAEFAKCLQEFSWRYIEPAVAVIANQIDGQIAASALNFTAKNPVRCNR
jgi:hypothetical protein